MLDIGAWQDILSSLILGLTPCEAFASLYWYILNGLSAKESAQIIYPVMLIGGHRGVEFLKIVSDTIRGTNQQVFDSRVKIWVRLKKRL